MSRVKEKLCAQFEALLDDLMQWRSDHPQASLDELAAQLTPYRRALMGQLLGALAVQTGNGYAWEGRTCDQCGQAMEYKGTPQRTLSHPEGEIELDRAYYYCPQCKRGLFPPG
jgi:hypothetical protein